MTCEEKKSTRIAPNGYFLKENVSKRVYFDGIFDDFIVNRLNRFEVI